MDEFSTEQDEKLEPSKTQSILIIDDEVEIHAALAEYLSDHGFLVTLRSNGSTGIQWARTYKPDLILLDIYMPLIDGFKTLRLLQKFSETRNIPVLMLTAKNDQKSVETAANIGIVGYITKPYELEKLLTRIQKVLADRMELLENPK